MMTLAERVEATRIALIAEEEKNCRTCQSPESFKPSHIASRRCESNGRRWDPATQTYIGNAHCSCDTCF